MDTSITHAAIATDLAAQCTGLGSATHPHIGARRRKRARHTVALGWPAGSIQNRKILSELIQPRPRVRYSMVELPLRGTIPASDCLTNFVGGVCRCEAVHIGTMGSSLFGKVLLRPRASTQDAAL